MRWLQAFRDGSADQRDLLGGKGANLAEMTRMGLPVPPGFTITTDACRAYHDGHRTLPNGLEDEIAAAVRDLEAEHGRRLGDADDPMLLSVRSGSKFSMPGMMDTILDLGLNDETVKGLAAVTGDERLAYDTYRRFVELYGRIVLGVPDRAFEQARRPILAASGVADAALLDAGGARDLGQAYRRVVECHTGAPFPTDPREQLRGAVAAVFRSWNGRRARDYRRHEGIPDDLGTAVNVQVMVFGNAGDDSGTGVAFTRDPATGEPAPYGDFLVNAQGEDVVAGVRVTEPLEAMRTRFPACHRELLDVMARLEARYRDLCDIEFTIEHGRLFVLQTRVGKRSAAAALRIALDLVREGLIDRDEALRRFTADHLEALLHPRFDPAATYQPLTVGLGASPGAASGAVVFTADEAAARAGGGDDVLLVRPETSPEDLHGLLAAQGVLTSRGGLVSHAAVVARGFGKPAVCGAAELEIDPDRGDIRHDGAVVARAGDVVSIDGSTGEVVLGAVPTVTPESTGELDTILGWADEVRRLDVEANADTPAEALLARQFGARGIGLCRTEHMFLGDRLPIVRRLILEDDPAAVDEALEELHQLQLRDFEGILEAMDGLPVTVRLLDPPLHEFLPSPRELAVRAAEGGLDAHEAALLHAAEHWSEANPMLGIRGVRLGILRPEIYRMQVRSLAEAVARRLAAGGDPHARVMVPLVVGAQELRQALDAVREELTAVAERLDRAIPVRLAAMIETPRAALRAAELAVTVDNLSFGTNDLTQLTFGFSRDDVEALLMPAYLEAGLLPVDPFRTLDVEGVGALVRYAAVSARAASPSVELGACGEHAGDPDSIAFLHDAGLDYVSCSPYRIRTARLAAARAALGAT